MPVRRMSAWTFGYYLSTSLIAIAIGIAVVNVIRPGANLDYGALVLGAGEAGHHASSDLDTVAAEGLGAKLSEAQA